MEEMAATASFFTSPPQSFSTTRPVRGGFNQPSMWGAGTKNNAEERSRQSRWSNIHCRRYAFNLICSFTNGVDWEGPYRLQFHVPMAWENRPVEFFNQDDRCSLDLVP